MAHPPRTWAFRRCEASCTLASHPARRFGTVFGVARTPSSSTSRGRIPDVRIRSSVGRAAAGHRVRQASRRAGVPLATVGERSIHQRRTWLDRELLKGDTMPTRTFALNSYTALVMLTASTLMGVAGCAANLDAAGDTGGDLNGTGGSIFGQTGSGGSTQLRRVRRTTPGVTGAGGAGAAPASSTELEARRIRARCSVTAVRPTRAATPVLGATSAPAAIPRAAAVPAPAVVRVPAAQREAARRERAARREAERVAPTATVSVMDPRPRR